MTCKQCEERTTYKTYLVHQVCNLNIHSKSVLQMVIQCICHLLLYKPGLRNRYRSESAIWPESESEKTYRFRTCFHVVTEHVLLHLYQGPLTIQSVRERVVGWILSIRFRKHSAGFKTDFIHTLVRWTGIRIRIGIGKKLAYSAALVYTVQTCYYIFLNEVVKSIF